MPENNNAGLVEEIASQVKQGLMETADSIIPWFFNALRDFYYQITPKKEQIKHLNTIISLKQTNTPSAMLRSEDDRQITFISTIEKNDQIVKFLQRLDQTNIRNCISHSSVEGDLTVCTLSSATTLVDFEDSEIKNRTQDIRDSLGDLYFQHKDKIEHYLRGLNEEYLARYDTSRICSHLQLYTQIKNYETVFSLDNDRDSKFSRIAFCTVNPPDTGYLRQICQIFVTHDIIVNRMYAYVVDTPGQEIALMTFYGIDSEGNQIQPDSVLWQRLQSAIKTVKWAEEDELSQLVGTGNISLSVRKANFLRATSTFVHQFLSKIQVERYTYEVVKKTLIKYPEISNLLVNYFYARCHPNVDDVYRHLGQENLGTIKQDLENAVSKVEEYAQDNIYSATVQFIDQMLKKKRAYAQQEILKKLHEEISKVRKFVSKDIFNCAIRFIDNILKTNYFIIDAPGLAFRMDPKVLDPGFYDPMPFGFFFLFGRNYKGFHVRFENMSRGGFRIVRTRDKEHYDFESTRVFDEVFNLAKAQQLKNKDIPEGGSKAIALLLPGANLNQCVECTIDSMLDLIVYSNKGRLNDKIVDYYVDEEIIYLGPDENMSDDRIEWIVRRAKEKKYKYPNAFMSSKPGVGINHKEFGVTSQGLNVYVEACLRYLKIDPKKDEFTVRIIGGPDGDVAGNEIKILLTSYPRVKILAISDGGGAAFDAMGLNRDELLRLVKESKSIVCFNKDLLSPSPSSFVVDANTVDGRQIRDDLQVSNIVKSDLLIPAGGRPNTIDSENWSQSLGEDGKPVFHAVVEGANLFLTNEARLALEKKGALVIKDSSANKGGVICSSYEIIASLILSEEEFLEIKPQYVAEVIEILKDKARMESKLLFREYGFRKGRTTLTELSSRLSEEINNLTGILKDYIQKEVEKEGMSAQHIRLLKNHCPKILVDKYSTRIIKDIPEEHRNAILSTQIASYIIYREGLGWMNNFPTANIHHAIKVYMEKDLLVADYIDKILQSNLPDKETIAKVLEYNARKELTREALA